MIMRLCRINHILDVLIVYALCGGRQTSENWVLDFKIQQGSATFHACCAELM